MQLSERNLVGAWRVVWKCGIERLDFRSDATYTQHIDYGGGGTATHSGTWVIKSRESFLAGGTIVLKDALQYCSAFGDRLPKPEQADLKLETIWEWGRIILSFNPDMQGFERQ